MPDTIATTDSPLEAAYLKCIQTGEFPFFILLNLFAAGSSCPADCCYLADSRSVLQSYLRRRWMNVLKVTEKMPQPPANPGSLIGDFFCMFRFVPRYFSSPMLAWGPCIIEVTRNGKWWGRGKIGHCGPCGKNNHQHFLTKPQGLELIAGTFASCSFEITSFFFHLLFSLGFYSLFSLWAGTFFSLRQHFRQSWNIQSEASSTWRPDANMAFQFQSETKMQKQMW